MSDAKNLDIFPLRSPILGRAKLCFRSNSATYRSSRKSGKFGSKIVQNKTSNTHRRLLHTFQGFTHQLDGLFLSLKEECLDSNGYSPEFTNYQDICDKLRLEVLIAIYKLEITRITGASYNEKNMEFLHKLNNLKYQLSDIRCQYQKAINVHFGLKDE